MPAFWEFKFWILKKSRHMTHLLKLVYKIPEYEMDLASIVEDTERTRFGLQKDGQMGRQSETSIPPLNFVSAGI